jgi:hypothetical protein
LFILDCPWVFSNLRSVSCVPNVASVSGLSILDCPWVFSNLRPVSCVPNVASVSLDCPFLIAFGFSLTFILTNAESHLKCTRSFITI